MATVPAQGLGLAGRWARGFEGKDGEIVWLYASQTWPGTVLKEPCPAPAGNGLAVEGRSAWDSGPTAVARAGGIAVPSQPGTSPTSAVWAPPLRFLTYK